MYGRTSARSWRGSAGREAGGHVAAIPRIRDAEPLRGPEGYLELIAMMRAGFPDVRWTLEETVTEGDTVAARFTMRGTHQGEFFGIPASGKTISVQAMNFYYLADGKIIKERGQPDLLGVMQQIGAVPAP
ncbi:ester cyclase [Amycolatopsis sp. H6(2020)]|nr:ester cyclase [Amycolatopsis sp. H6(2020)]